MTDIKEAPGYTNFVSPKVDVDLEAPREEGKVRGASVLQLLLISLPRMAINMAWAAQYAALGPYLGTMLSPTAVQITQFIGPTMGILVAPTVGVFSDRCTNKWGRRRPFLIWAAIFSAICYTLMGYTADIGEWLGDVGTGSDGETTHRTWTCVFTIIFYAWMDITVNVVQTPMFLLVADFAGDRQTLGAAIGMGWGTLGAIMVSGYIYFFGAAYLSLHWFLFMLSLTMIISVAICCLVAKETPLSKDAVSKESSMKQIKNAFASIYHGLKALPNVLVIYCFVFFCVMYGYTAYNGNKGQFFGLAVYKGDATGADSCGNACTQAQNDYNHGVEVAGGSTDTFYNLVGYAFSWILPLLVKKFGAKWVLVAALLPQSLLMVMAFCKVVMIDQIIVIVTSMSQITVFALLVPIIVHVFGDNIDIGMYVGALNSANCLGQLINYAIGAAIVNTSLGYKLPVFVGGAMSFIGVIVGTFFLKLKMYSM